MTDKDILWHLEWCAFFEGFCVGNLPCNYFRKCCNRVL